MPVKLLSVPDLHLLNSSSLPVTVITMKANPSLSRASPFLTRAFSDKLKYRSLSSSNNLGFPKLMTTPQLELHISTRVSNHGSEIRAAKSLIEDESDLSDWFNQSGSFEKMQFYGESDDGRSSDRGGRGGSAVNRRSDDYNGGYRGGGNRDSFDGSSRGGGYRGSFGGSSRGGGGDRGSFSGSSRGGGSRCSFGTSPRGGLRSSFGGSSRGNGRFGGEFGSRDEEFRSTRENRFEGGRGPSSSTGRYGGEVERINVGVSRDSSKGKGTWGSFDSFSKGKEPYVRDTEVEDDRFVSNRRDDSFNGNGRGRGRGGE